MIEKPGTKLSSLLVKADPWSGEECRRKECNTCGDNPEGANQCKVRSVIYENQCQECKDEGKIVKYVGEPGRSMKERRLNHEEDARGKKRREKSNMQNS